MKQIFALTFLFLTSSCQVPPPAGQRIVDLTHALNSKNPHWPGPGYEPFKYETFATLEKDGALSGRFTMAEHTGTHLDAPNHFTEGQISFDKYKNADSSGALHFPGFSIEAAKLLAEDRDVAGIGIDTLSVDYGMSKDFAVHHAVHGRGKYHLENVANLGSMPAAGAQLVVAPIKIENGTGGPARIFALIRE